MGRLLPLFSPLYLGLPLLRQLLPGGEVVRAVLQHGRRARQQPHHQLVAREADPTEEADLDTEHQYRKRSCHYNTD